MAVGFNNATSTDYNAAAGTGTGSRTITMPSSAGVGDFLVVVRHHSSSSSALSGGNVDGVLSTNLYTATGSTSIHGQRRIFQSGDGNWTWTNAGTDWAHAAIRFTGTASGNPFTGGTAWGTGTAGEGAGTTSSQALTVGDADAGEMGVIFVISSQAVTGVSANWNYQQLVSGTRIITLVWRAYSGTVTADACTVTFAASAQVVTRHGILAAGATPPQTITATGIASEEAFGTAAISQPGFITPAGIASEEAFGSATITAGTATIAPTGIASAETFGTATVANVTLNRVVILGDSITQGAQAGLGNRWPDYLFGTASSLTSPNASFWRDGTYNGNAIRVYEGAIQGANAREITQNYSFPNAHDDGDVDCLILMFGANDENEGRTLQQFEDDLVLLANGGLSSDFPLAPYVVVVGEWAWSRYDGGGSPSSPSSDQHADFLARAEIAAGRIESELSHVERCVYVEFASDAAASGGVNFATCGSPYAIDTIHPNASGHSSVVAPTVRTGLTQLFGVDAVVPSGIASEEAFGSATVAPGAVTVSPSGIGTAESFGTATVSAGGTTVAPTGIASGEAFGTAVVSGAGSVILYPPSIDTGEAFGTALLSPGVVVVGPSGIASVEAHGTPTVSHGGLVTYTTEIRIRRRQAITMNTIYAGEIPAPFDLTISDGGVPFDLTGFTAEAAYRIDDGPEVSMTAAVFDASGGVIRLSPVEADFARPGVMRGVAWASQGGVREVAAVFVIPVRTPPAAVT